ncbi:hypothetical protein [Citreimonas sp.]|uniref:hypothetical protein n=1 Tax=Citreimonas sp. TaxID=3036715 RepID=UPI004059BF73
MPVPRSPDHPKPMRWSRLYARHCPHRTDPTSRHVKVIAEGLRDLRSPMREALAGYDPDHMASSLELTVKMLWEARAEIERLKAKAPTPGA